MFMNKKYPANCSKTFRALWYGWTFQSSSKCALRQQLAISLTLNSTYMCMCPPTSSHWGYIPDFLETLLRSAPILLSPFLFTLSPLTPLNHLVWEMFASYDNAKIQEIFYGRAKEREICAFGTSSVWKPRQWRLQFRLLISTTNIMIRHQLATRQRAEWTET